MIINSNYSNNSVSFKANYASRIQRKEISGLRNIIHKYYPDLEKTLEAYLERIDKFNKGYKIIYVDTPLPFKSKYIPEQRSYYLVSQNYHPELPATQDYYVLLHTKKRLSENDKMYLTLNDLRAISENFPVSPQRWERGNVIKEYAKKVLRRGIIISSAAPHYKKPKQVNIAPSQQPQQQCPVCKIHVPCVSKLIKPMPIRPIVSPYRIPENPLMLIPNKNQLPELIIQRQAELFNRDLKKISDECSHRPNVKKGLQKLQNLLGNDKLIYLKDKNGINQVWLLSEVGKKDATPVYDAPLFNSVPLRMLITNLEERQANHLSVIG